MSGRKKLLIKRKFNAYRHPYLLYREIFDEPVTVGKHSYTEVHIIVYTHKYGLTLRGKAGAPLLTVWKNFAEHCELYPSHTRLQEQAEKLVAWVREGKPFNFRNDPFGSVLV